MQRRFYYLLMVLFGASLFLVACAVRVPTNLVVASATIDFDAETVSISVSNTGGADAGEHLTYVEINSVDADDDLKPQCQYAFNVPIIAANDTWSPDPIPFTSFSCPPGGRGGLDLPNLETANLVVIADAKNMVAESNENDNISDTVVVR